MGPRGLKVNSSATGGFLFVRPYEVFTIEVIGDALSAGDRIRIVEGACGGKNSTPALHGPLRADPDAAAAFGNATYLRWESVELRDVGDFTVCWCSASVTCAWQDYRTPAGVVRVAATAGPAYANVTAVAAGVPFAVRVVGFNMSTSDRARVVASPAAGSACASANAEALRGPLADDPNLPGAIEDGDVAESGRLRPSAAASEKVGGHLGTRSVRRNWYRSLSTSGRLQKARESCCILKKSRKNSVKHFWQKFNS